MTDLWIENGTKSKSTGLIIAPESFELRRDVVLIDTGVTLRKGKAFFTYAEVEALRKQTSSLRAGNCPLTRRQRRYSRNSSRNPTIRATVS